MQPRSHQGSRHDPSRGLRDSPRLIHPWRVSQKTKWKPGGFVALGFPLWDHDRALTTPVRRCAAVRVPVANADGEEFEEAPRCTFASLAINLGKISLVEFCAVNSKVHGLPSVGFVAETLLLPLGDF